MDKMDLVAFFRIAVPVVLAVFSMGLILAINVIFIGNAFYILKRCFKKEVYIGMASIEQNKSIRLRFNKPQAPEDILPKAG
jgi:hypothetical protein